ncbi:MAG: histidine kinase [Planctomycetota bacterium]
MGLDAYLIAQCLGFAIGLALFAVLVGLFVASGWRERRLPRALVGFGAWFGGLCCAWNGASLWLHGALLAGAEAVPAVPSLIADLSLALLPTGALGFVVGSLVVGARTRVALRFLIGASAAAGCALAVGLVLEWSGDAPSTMGSAKRWAAYNQMAHGAVKLPLLLAPRWHSIEVRRFCRATWVVGAILSALLALTFVDALDARAERLVALVAMQTPLVWAVLSFGIFAPFRFADRFVRKSLLVAGALVLASSFQIAVVGPLADAARQTSAAAAGLVTALAWSAFLFAMFPLARGLGRLLDRSLFRRPDYRAVLGELTDQMRGLEDRDALERLVQATLCASLDLERVELRAVPNDRGPAAASPRRGQLPEVVLDATVEPGGGAQHWVLLAAGPEDGELGLLLHSGPGTRRLLSEELAFLQRVGVVVTRHLDGLALLDRERRAAQLEQQVTAAELRALRAQLDPHFLFNTLNTIAETVRRDPEAAERMVERLAAVFRFALGRAQREVATLGEEIDFVRQYLEIEKVRFGARLRVRVDVTPQVREQRVPALLLQPLVENALRHGLAPRVEPGTVTVAARETAGGFEVSVADDGVGFDADAAGVATGSGAGLGWRATVERVRAFFGDRADLSLRTQPGAGTRVVLRVEGCS